MTYSEIDDIAEHTKDIETMDWRLKQANVKLDWSNSVALDVGGAGGLHSAMLASRCKRIYCSDIVDCNTQYNGEFIRLLSEKCTRHGLSLPIDRIEFNLCDATDMIYRDSMFDFVCSFNAFEHIPEPSAALAEIARVLKPGGVCYITFDPLWTADTGSHFAHLVNNEPWAHLLMSGEAFLTKMKLSGASITELDEFKIAMNRYSLQSFDELFKVNAAKLTLQLQYYLNWQGCQVESAEQHENFYKAKEKGYTYNDLMTRGVSVIFRNEKG